MRFLNTIIFALLFCQVLIAQPDNIIFKNVSKGLSQNTINSIAQDEYGFLWIGTLYGLNRYDGTTIKNFVPDSNDSLAIRGRNIKDILPDMNGGIWIATYGSGLNYYDVHKDEFHPIGSSEVASENSICLFETSDGELLMGVNDSGLFLVDKENKSLSLYNNGKPESKKIFFNEVFSIIEDKKGNLLIAKDDGISMIRKEDKKVFEYGTESGLPDARVRTLYCSENGSVWAGTDAGIRELIFSDTYELSVKKVGLKSEDRFGDLNNVVILSIVEKDNYLWVGSENYGLYQVDLSTGKIHTHQNTPHNSNSLSSNSIWELFKDQDETIWLGGFTSGLDKIETLENKIKHSRNLTKKNLDWDFRKVTCFVEDNSNNIWIGSDIDGLTKMDEESNLENFQKEKGKLNTANNNIFSMEIDNDQNLWVGTWGGGVTIVDKNRTKATFLQHDPNDKNSIIGNDIHAITKDREGNIWVAAFQKGLNVFHPEKGIIRTFKENSESKYKISDDQILSILRDQKGHLWLGYDYGIEKLILNDNLEIVSSQRFLTGKNNEFGISVLAFYNDSQNNVWATTVGSGLLKFSEDDTMTTYKKSDGLSSNILYSLLEDNNGLLWMTADNSICSLDPQTEVFQCFELEDENLKTEFFKSSSLRAKDGTLYFGSNSGFYYFDPKTLQSNEKKPIVYITDLRVSGNPPCPSKGLHSKYILNGQSITCHHDKNDLAFEFTSISYLNSSKNKFQYKLENHDEEWRTAGIDRKVSYPNVPPGKYVFKVKGANNDGLWNEEFASCKIIIQSPWYATIWAYLVYAILGIVGLWFFRKETLKRIELKNQMKYDQLEIEKIKEIDKLKETFFTNVSHEFRTPLTLIMSPLEVLLKRKDTPEEVDGLYQTMMKNAKYLNRLINQILEISRLESGQSELKATTNDFSKFLNQTALGFTSFADNTNKSFKINIPQKAIPLLFDKEKIKKVVFNLLSNAFKYSEENGKITLTLEEEKNNVIIKVINTGNPIPEEEQEKIFERFYKSKDKSSNVSTGIGLTLSKQLVELHGGKIKVESEAMYSSGLTTFSVILPKGEKILSSIASLVQPSINEEKLSKTLHSTKVENQVYEKIKTVPLSGNKPLVLLVEDNKDMREFMCMFLKEDYDIIQAQDGIEGFDLALKHIPELIISDVMMPNLDGYQLARKLKENPLTCHIFLILLSAKSSEESIHEGLSIGVDNYLTKPFNPTQLQLRIKNLLNTRTRFKEQILETKPLDPAPSEVPYSNFDEEFIKKTISIIESRISDTDFKVDALCHDIGMSKSQLNRKLRGLVDKSPNEFIRMIKLKRAAQLLRKTDKRISEITFEVGFSDLQYFRESFKNQYGVSPSEFKSAFVKT